MLPRRSPTSESARVAWAYDEMFHADGTVRSAYRALHDAIAPTAADLAVRSEALDRAHVDQGITFSLSGQERPFPGRDYADVPPLKGIYSGGTAAALDVVVNMTRLA